MSFDRDARQGQRQADTSELRALLRQFRGAGLSIALVGVVLNVLALAGAIYMMLIYDRVLVSASIQSLFSLFAILVVLYLFQGVFDTLRARMLQLVGAGIDKRLALRLQRLESDLVVQGKLGALPSTPMRDLDHVRSFFFGQGPAAILDLPWILFFLLILWLLHPALGITTLVGALLLGFVTWLNDRQTRSGVEEATAIGRKHSALSERVRRNIQAIKGLSISGRMNGMVDAAHSDVVQAQTTLSASTAKYSALTRGLRMFIQSAVLTVGAILVIGGQATAGVIFASSILAGRALAPVDQAVANWRGFVAARQAWQRLNPLLEANPARPEPSVMLDVPRERIQVEHLTVVPPRTDRVVANGVTFSLGAGDALAVVGPSGSGKSSLVRALVNIWPAAAGVVRLDGAPLDQYHEARLQEAIGYLPQEVELFAGTIAQNISRFDPVPSSEQIVAAATAAGIHQLVLSLPQGYDTPVGDSGAELSAGQRQRVALARALYGDPFILVLDEPDSNLDPEGELALANTIGAVRKRGGIAIVVSHRLALLKTVNWMLVMRDGKQEAFGQRDQVLAELKRKGAGRTSVAEPAPVR